MVTREQDKQDSHERHQREAAIGEHVIDTLGRPGGLQRVQVRQLWQDHYRVNLFVGGDLTSVKVTHSYFVLADSAGNIVKSTPKISK